jgi:hypothetical protein
VGLASRERGVDPQAVQPAPGVAAAVPVFRLSCSPGKLTSSTRGPSTCEVHSMGGFSAEVQLACVGVPDSLRCEFSPASVTPPANGKAKFRLSVQTDQVRPGQHQFKIAGRGGGASADLGFQVDTTPIPSGPTRRGAVTIGCAAQNVYTFPGKTITSECLVGSSGFTGAVALACDVPDGVTCETSTKQLTHDSVAAGTYQEIKFTLRLAVLPGSTNFGMFQAKVTGSAPGADPALPQPHTEFTFFVEKPSYAAACNSVTAAAGSTVTVHCHAMSLSNQFHHPIFLSVAARGPGPSASLSQVSLPADRAGAAPFSVTLTVPPSVAPGEYRFDVGMTHIQGGPPLPQDFGALPGPSNGIVLTVTDPANATQPPMPPLPW